MSKNMTPPQLEKAVDQYRAALTKLAHALPSRAVQLALGHPRLVKEMSELFKETVLSFGRMVTFDVTVDISISPEAKIAATGHKEGRDIMGPAFESDVIAEMPKGAGGKMTLLFFHPKYSVSCEELMKEYGFRGLRPATPYELASAHEQGLDLFGGNQTCTIWKNSADEYCKMMFDRFDAPSVYVGRKMCGEFGGKWYAGVAK
jgi:hypothetical protein